MKLSGTWTRATAPGCPPDASQAVDPRAGRSGTPCGRGSHRLRGLAPEASARLSSYTLGLYVRPQLVTLQVSFSDLEPPLVDQNRSSQVLLEACLQQLQLLPQLCFIAPRRRNSHLRIAKAQILKRTATAPQGVAMAKRRFSTALPTPEPSLSPPYHLDSQVLLCEIAASWLHLIRRGAAPLIDQQAIVARLLCLPRSLHPGIYVHSIIYMT